MTTARIMKWIAGGLEVILGVPLLGAAIVIGGSYVPLLFMLALHIATLVICVKSGETKAPSILGIVTSVVAVIPFVGMVMHIITAVLLMMDAAKPAAVKKDQDISV